MSKVKKVLVGMSGGVDSAVAAMKLMDLGYEVTGATLKLWDEESSKENEGGRTCCSLEDVEDARAVANKLGIPFYVLNMKELFNEKVVDYFTASYLEGLTPNPCIACNRYIKFEAMLEKAVDLGFEYIATGHYARVIQDEKSGRYLLKKAKDPSKDQSYVLYMLKQEQLKRLLLPLGDTVKSETRLAAQEKGLRVSDKPDSQDICFVSGGRYGDFIRDHAKVDIQPGHFIDQNGQILGRHKGIVNYTVGQRKGLGLSSSAPLYVIAKNIKDNTVMLAHKAEAVRSSLTARDMNYIAFDKPPAEFKASVKVRYSTGEAPATVVPLDHDRVRIEFDTPQIFIAAGQAVVLYDGDLVLGGGTIE